MLQGACRMLVEGHGILHFLVRLVGAATSFPGIHCLELGQGCGWRASPDKPNELYRHG